MDVYKPSTLNLDSLMLTISRKFTDYPFMVLYINCIHIGPIKEQLAIAIENSPYKGKVVLINPVESGLIDPADYSWETDQINKYGLSTTASVDNRILDELQITYSKDLSFNTIDNNLLSQYEYTTKQQHAKLYQSFSFIPDST
jgi:hypothetical protein